MIVITINEGGQFICSPVINRRTGEVGLVSRWLLTCWGVYELNDGNQRFTRLDVSSLDASRLDVSRLDAFRLDSSRLEVFRLNTYPAPLV